MGRAAKLRRARKTFKINRPPIPDYDSLKPIFSSEELKNWLIYEWELCLDFKLFVQHHRKQELAGVMLKQLYIQLKNDCNQDLRVEYNLNQQFFVAVGINVYTWTVWAFIADRVTGIEIVTSDEKEFKLKSRLKPSKR